MHRRVSAALAVVALVAACGGQPRPTPELHPTSSPSASLFQSSTVGQYRLDLRLDRLSWRVGEPMTGTATLAHLDPSPVNLVGAGSGLIAFDYIEDGGGRALLEPSTADCAPHELAAGTTVIAPLGKGGAFDPANPSDAWIAQVLGSSGVQLPAGTWDVTARATFYENTCGGPSYAIDATLRVVVVP